MPLRGRDADAEDRVRFQHMLDAARDAIAFTRGRTRHDLDQDRMLLRALVHCVQVIGEAGARMSDKGRARAAELPWPKMVGMRHILVHVYYDIDADAVWRVVEEHLPSLVEVVQKTLDNWGEASEGGA